MRAAQTITSTIFFIQSTHAFCRTTSVSEVFKLQHIIEFSSFKFLFAELNNIYMIQCTVTHRRPGHGCFLQNLLFDSFYSFLI